MPGLPQPLLQPQLSEKQLEKLQELYKHFGNILDDPFADDEMLSNAIKKLAAEEDMKLSEEFILEWLKKRKKEIGKKKTQ